MKPQTIPQHLAIPYALLEDTIRDSWHYNKDDLPQFKRAVEIQMHAPRSCSRKVCKEAQELFKKLHGRQYEIKEIYTVPVTFHTDHPRITRYSLVHFSIGTCSGWDVLPEEHIRDILGGGET